MTQSNSETTNSSSLNGQDSSSQGLLSRLWQWINSYGGLSDLRKYNAELKKSNEELSRETEELSRETEALRQQNARLAELESKLDIVLQSSDSNLIPTISTDDN
jgi:predicted nuclease with TOPRIM domain